MKRAGRESNEKNKPEKASVAISSARNDEKSQGSFHEQLYVPIKLGQERKVTNL